MPRNAPSDLQRFTPDWWAAHVRVDALAGCHVWHGATCRLGYGRVWNGGKSPELVHRLAYRCAFGDFDQALKVCHRCDNPSCVNPAHLFLGTQKDNLRDMFAKGRARPRGRVPRRQSPVSAPVTPASDANTVIRDVSSRCYYYLHSTSYAYQEESAEIAAGWRRVIGVPAERPTQAIVLWQPPLAQAVKPASDRAQGLPTVQTPAPCCASAGSLAFPSPPPSPVSGGTR